MPRCIMAKTFRQISATRLKTPSLASLQIMLSGQLSPSQLVQEINDKIARHHVITYPHDNNRL